MSGCDCPCHVVIQPGLISCPSCDEDIPAARPCRICGLEPGTRHGRCNTCRSYHRQHGTERPYELIRRQLQREATQRL